MTRVIGQMLNRDLTITHRGTRYVTLPPSLTEAKREREVFGLLTMNVAQAVVAACFDVESKLSVGH